MEMYDYRFEKLVAGEYPVKFAWYIKAGIIPCLFLVLLIYRIF
jgi:hypothetical protein